MAMVVSPSVRPQVVAFSMPADADAFTDSLRGRAREGRELRKRQRHNQQAATHNLQRQCKHDSGRLLAQHCLCLCLVLVPAAAAGHTHS